MFLIIWLGMLFIVSVLPVSGPQTDLPSDTIAHFVIYGITAILLFRHFNKKYKKRKAIVFSFIFASIYGAIMEMVQYLLPYREFSMIDIASNTSGAFLFSLIYAKFKNNKP